MVFVNPFNEIAQTIPPSAMKTFVLIMILLVVVGTIFDVIHKKSAKYFFMNMKKANKEGTRRVGGSEKLGIAAATAAHDVLASGEFCSRNRRIAHLLTMYGFILFAATSNIMIFKYTGSGMATPAIFTLLWHLGALMVCVGGFWFWFFIRADVAAEGNSPFRFMLADLFIVSLVATVAFGLLWSFFQSMLGVGLVSWLFFLLFVASLLALFGGVPWSKFAHMFFKPAAAYQNRLADANGSRSNLPEPADAPANFGLGIKRDRPRHY